MAHLPEAEAGSIGKIQVVDHSPASKVDHSPTTVPSEVQDFLLDRQANNVSPATLRWHTHALRHWLTFCEDNSITTTALVTPRHLRHFLVDLAKRHNPGGVSNIYRSVKAFVRWYAAEYQPLGWTDPLAKVRTPTVPDEILSPVPAADVQAMLARCTPRTFTGERDRALLLLLLDTGVRRQEVLDLNIGDVNLETGAVLVRQGKGRKGRTVFVGARARRALLSYYRMRGNTDPDTPLWLTDEGNRLTITGLREILRRRARSANVAVPTPHSFRRAFAINCLRNGMDLVTLQRLMGHASLAIITKYLQLVNDDLQAAHAKYGVVDNL